MSRPRQPLARRAVEALRSTAGPGRARAIALAVLLLLYVLLTLGVIFDSPVLDWDKYLFDLHLHGHHPSWKPWIESYVMFGQRGPSTLVFLPYFVWTVWRRRSTGPLVLLVTALVVLNLSVGAVKFAIGRMGPIHYAPVHDVFAGGNIYPSGHISNTVVLYGVIAMVASRYRTFAVWAAAFLSVTVGAGTIYLRTHWLSDVVGGWIAGGLVLLVLPTLAPVVQRWVDRALDRLRARYASPGAHAAGVAPVPAGRRSIAARRIAGQPANGTTPVRALAASQSRLATASSFDADDEPTRRGDPRSSPIPPGP